MDPGRDVRAPSPSPPRDRILKCTKTEEFSSLNGKKGAEAGFRSRVGGRAYVKCTGWSGVGCEWAEMAEIQKKQNPTSVDRSRPRGHLGCKGGCLEYKRELLGARKWPGSGAYVGALASCSICLAMGLTSPSRSSQRFIVSVVPCLLAIRFVARLLDSQIHLAKHPAIPLT